MLRGAHAEMEISYGKFVSQMDVALLRGRVPCDQIWICDSITQPVRRS